LTRELTPVIPEERRDDLQLTVYLADSATRRAMRRAEDIGAWLDAYWLEQDPTPGTPTNEALEVYRQRAAWLQEKMPEIPFGEWSDNWAVFLQHGTPDAIRPESIPWKRVEDTGLARTPARIIQVDRQEWRYRSPRSYSIVFRESELLRDPRESIPDLPHSLAGDWEALETAGSSAIDRRTALIDLSWYELPEVAERLLAVPANRLLALGVQARNEAFTRLARRIFYRHGTDGAQRLSALAAAGADPALLLSRAASDSYPLEALQSDLIPLSDRRFRIPRTPNRGPHPGVWSDLEGLFERLVRDFPDPNRITGWDWRGDVYLALGPPAVLDTQNRIAYYLWGTPEGLGIGETMFGWVEAVRLNDMLRDFVEEVKMRELRRHEVAQRAAIDVARVLSGSEGSAPDITDEMLRQLNELAPPNVFRAGVPLGGEVLPLTVDVVGFPAGEDSVEVQASFGIPAAAVGIREDNLGYATDLRTNLVLVDYDIQVREAMTRQEGYRIEGGTDPTGRVFLDTFRFKTGTGSYVIYMSAEDPTTNRSGGVLASVELPASGTGKLMISPIMLATEIRPATQTGKFVREGLRILPVPARRFYYGQDLYFYFQVNNLTRSEVGDYVWDEAYYIIPQAAGEGIVRIDPEENHTRLTPSAARSMAVDLSSMAETYEGDVFLVVLLTDMVSGEQAVSATRFSLLVPPQR
jgi:GWxTD domain-containing protein